MWHLCKLTGTRKPFSHDCTSAQLNAITYIDHYRSITYIVGDQHFSPRIAGIWQLYVQHQSVSSSSCQVRMLDERNLPTFQTQSLTTKKVPCHLRHGGIFRWEEQAPIVAFRCSARHLLNFTSAIWHASKREAGTFARVGSATILQLKLKSSTSSSRKNATSISFVWNNSNKL